MSLSEPNAADLERAHKLRREKNRIAQQKHREKKRKEIEKKTKEIERKAKCIEKFMAILQKVKLAVAIHDIGQIEELVKTPSIKLPTNESSILDNSSQTASVADINELLPMSDDSFSSSQPSMELETATTMEDNALVGPDFLSSFPPKPDENISLSTQGLFQPTYDPFFWDMGMGNMFPPFQMPYFDAQSSLNSFPPFPMPNTWESYPAIMASV